MWAKTVAFDLPHPGVTSITESVNECYRNVTPATALKRPCVVRIYWSARIITSLTSQTNQFATTSPLRSATLPRLRQHICPLVLETNHAQRCTPPSRGNSLPHRRLRMIVFVGCASIIALWGRYHFTTVQVNNDPTSTPDLAAATEAAQPLLDALEKYHAENGLYPATLDQLPSKQLPSLRVHGYLYSARGDWVYKSDPCVARETPPWLDNERS